MTHWRNHNLVDEQADHDRWGAEQDIVDEAHNAGQALVAPVLGHVSASKNADWRPDHDSKNRQDKTAHNRIQQAASAAGRGGHLCEDLERKATEALPEQDSKNNDEPA